jgi:hypothetical protein
MRQGTLLIRPSMMGAVVEIVFRRGGRPAIAGRMSGGLVLQIEFGPEFPKHRGVHGTRPESRR